MRVLVVLALLTRLAAAEAPTRKQAENAARAWVENGETALATSVDPFLFDHDNKACKKHKKAKPIIECLLVDETTYPIRNWAPTRVRTHMDSTFASWQRNAKRDVIAKHKRKLAKLTDQVFVHFDAAAEGGIWEMVIPVTLDADGSPIVTGYLANWLPATRPTEAEARALASSWVRGMGDSDDTRKSTAHRTGYPFWSLGLPGSNKGGCKPLQRAKDSKQFAEISACVAASANHDLLGMLPHSKWEVVDDPIAIKTRADKDEDNFTAALDQLDRLAHDHLFLYNRVTADEIHFEIVLAIRRNAEAVVVAAVVANLY